MTKTLAVGLLLAVVGITGCGQKGPLYLPHQAPSRGSDAKSDSVKTGSKPQIGPISTVPADRGGPTH